MKSSLDEFEQRLLSEWLPDFCHDEHRRHSLDGFKETSIKVSEIDAINFMRAIDSGLVIDSGGGRYRCARSNAFEQIFWTGPKSTSPRSLTLWIEPIVTIGTIARLGIDYGWPSEVLCMQSKDWAFDFAVYKSATSDQEYIAGEVKKTKGELDSLIADLVEFGQLGEAECRYDHPKKVNSFKKWLALLRSEAPLFWAVGPDNYTKLFTVEYGEGNITTITETDLDQLKFRRR